MMEFYNQKNVKARKLHYCEFCGKTIGAGEVYSCETGKYDGDFFTRKLCLPCSNMLDAFCRENGDEDFQWDWIQEWLYDQYCSEECRNSCSYGFSRIQCCSIVRDKFTREIEEY